MSILVYKNRVGKSWTPQEVTYLIRQHSNSVPTSKVCKEMGRSFGSVRSKVKELVGGGLIESNQFQRGFGEAERFIPTEEVNHDKFIRVFGDTLNISDVHIPFWHRELFKKSILIAKKFKIKTLIVNGDFLNMDSFSRWVTSFRGRADTLRELNTANYFLQECLKHFDKIYLTSGNHEDRLLKTFQGQIPQSVFMKMVNYEIGKKITVSDYAYCHVNDTWKIVHPSSYSQEGGKTPVELAATYDMNVIAGHNHQFGVQVSRNGKYVGIDHGCMADPLKIEYYNLSVSKGRRWQPGFSMIRKNKGYAFSFNHTDWDFWLK